MEEAHVLPLFRAAHPEEAEAILAEHRELTRQLDELGVRVDLHALSLAEVDELARLVRLHGEREEKLLYPFVGGAGAQGASPR